MGRFICDSTGFMQMIRAFALSDELYDYFREQDLTWKTQEKNIKETKGTIDVYAAIV